MTERELLKEELTKVEEKRRALELERAELEKLQQLDAELALDVGAARSRVVRRVYVWEAPIRMWHWVDAACIVALCVTGFLIGRPPPTVGGEASAHYVFGWVRFVHFAAAYGFAVGFVMRVYWAFAGNVYARQMFVIPVRDREFWRGVVQGLLWYTFLVKHPKRYVGHNPQAQLITFLLFTLGTVFMVATGFALYGQGTGDGSWANTAFGWVVPLVGGGERLHVLHRLGMWSMVLFVVAHIYAVVRDDIMSRQSQVSSMISGWRTFKD